MCTPCVSHAVPNVSEHLGTAITRLTRSLSLSLPLSLSFSVSLYFSISLLIVVRPGYIGRGGARGVRVGLSSAGPGTGAEARRLQSHQGRLAQRRY